MSADIIHLTNTVFPKLVHPLKTYFKRKREQHMTLSTTAAAMDAEIRLVARFHTLIIWRAAVSTSLLVFQVIYTISGLYTASPAYILLTANLLPTLLEPLCSPRIHKSSPVLPYLRKRYHYSSLRFMTLEITFLAANLLLLIWQLFGNYTDTWLSKLPAILLLSSLLWHFIAPSILFRHIQKKMGC